jgi:type II secretory pathway pseudopilin PulG
MDRQKVLPADGRRLGQAGQALAFQRGVGLLEAIVALVLLATTAAVLLSWLQHNLDTMRRLEQRERALQIQLNAQSWASTLNPAREPQGERQVADMRVRWRSEVLSRPGSPLLSEVATSDQWQVGLYRLWITAQAASGSEPVVEFSLLQTGTLAPANSALRR